MNTNETPIRFTASCAVHNLTFGASDIDAYTEHFTKVHELAIWKNTGIRTPGWLTAKPYNFKAPRVGHGLPPVGYRREQYLAAMVS